MCSANYSNLSPWLILPELETKGFPSIQQTAYQCGVSCDLRRLWNPYQSCTEREHCLPDFLWQRWVLHSIKAHGIHGKCWRIIQSFYYRPKGHVNVNGCLSPGFLIEPGVRQGSVLSPTLAWCSESTRVSMVCETSAGSMLNREIMSEGIQSIWPAVPLGVWSLVAMSGQHGQCRLRIASYRHMG